MNYSRIISSIFLFFFLFFCMTSFFFFKVCFIHLLSFLTLREYLRISKLNKIKIKKINYTNDILLTRTRLDLKDYLSLLLCQVVLLIDTKEYFNFFFIGAIFIIVCGIQIFSKVKIHYILGIFYLLLPFLFFNYVGYERYFFFLMLVFLITVSTDIGAYIFGKVIGGAKIVPSISPNKTWAGFFGGIFFTLIVGSFVFDIQQNQILSFFFFLAASITSQFGDIIESALKRKVNIKDSGNLIPGHGGILDRLDSFFTITFFVMLLYFLNFDFLSFFVL